MRTIGNILWFIFGGLLGGLAWIFAGCIWCITIIGIPVGKQCFKMATLSYAIWCQCDRIKEKIKRICFIG